MSTKAARFEGRGNAGLRAKIRTYARNARENGEDVYEAVLSIRHVVALTGPSLATLAQVAEDYASGGA